MGPAVANLPVENFPTADPYAGSIISGTGTYAYSQYPSSSG
jgi:hypothetical protein